MPVSQEYRQAMRLPGRSGIETSLALSQDYGRVFMGRKLMDVETVKQILQTLNDNNIQHALIGGLAVAQHGIARTTLDVDVLILVEDAGRVRKLFSEHYLGGVPDFQSIKIAETKVDFMAANLRCKRQALMEAEETTVEGVPTRVVKPHDLVLLKLLAIPDCPNPVKAMQDKTDVADVMQNNPDDFTSETIAYICRQLLNLAFTEQDVQKYYQVIQWLNETLELLGLADRGFRLTGLLRFHAIPASQRQLSVTEGWLPLVAQAVVLSTGVTPTVPAGGSVVGKGLCPCPPDQDRLALSAFSVLRGGLPPATAEPKVSRSASGGIDHWGGEKFRPN
jgi:hypothetical protein